MKVHIVIGHNGHHDEVEIVAVYLDEDKAEERTLFEQGNDKYNVYEYETHEVE